MKKTLAAGLLSLFALSSCASAGEPIFYSTGTNMPFSEAVQVGDMLYLSGQIGVAPGDNKLASGGITGETRQTMDNIGATLQRRGLGFSSIVKCTVMLADMADWQAFNAVYVTYFTPGRLPARSAFGSTGLAYNGRIELECWAYNPQQRLRKNGN